MSWLLHIFGVGLCIFSHNVSGQDDETARLQVARAAFNKINHGGYEFQYAASCFCLTCYTQAMDIKVKNNEVEEVTFAEGNDFALDNFCGGNEDAFSHVLESSSKTIDSLFDLIEDAINHSLPFEVEYHDTIGIPLSLYIDRVPGAIDDEMYYFVNCIEFKKESKTSKRSKDSKSSKGSKSAERQIKDFNKKDDYSCKNVHTPDHCPVHQFECNRFYDGCNTCSCDGEHTIGCTKRVCLDYGDKRCLDCESNTEWDTCGHDCNPTCDVPCSSDDCKSARCQCPVSLPIWDGAECVTEDECTPAPIIGQPFCVENCIEYTDGCQACECDKNGLAVSCDNPGGCEPGFSAAATCTKCEDEDTMTYTGCGGCTTTCQQYLHNEIMPCIAMCQAKCECNKDTPLYSPDEGKCVSKTECETPTGNVTTTSEEPVLPTECPNHCLSYFNGCNDCQCGLNGMVICTTKFCPEPEAATCQKCEDEETMEYTTCGGCDVTCDDLNPICTLQCRRKCQCQRDTPIYDADNRKCITLDECPESLPSTTEEVEADDYCPVHCKTYFDGCNDCNCADPKRPACTLKFCPESEHPTCQKCEDAETMEFTTCGTCDQTCDDLNPICTRECKVKCQCKSDTPIYDPVNKQCIKVDECKSGNNTKSEKSDESEMFALPTDNNTNGNIGTVFVVLFAVAIVIFGCWMFCNKQRDGYEKIDSSKKVMHASSALNM